MKHDWDYPNDKISSRCKKCNLFRMAMKLGGKMTWVYYPSYTGIEKFKCPPCNKIISYQETHKQG